MANCASSVQVNIPAESGDMGVLANHVPTIEQLRPGLIEIIEESGGSKQFFRMFRLGIGFSLTLWTNRRRRCGEITSEEQYADLDDG